MTDEELIERLRGTGPEQRLALRDLYARKARDFGRYFLSQGVLSGDVDDIVQHVVIRLLAQAKSFRGDGSANAWMWQVARNSLVDHYRRPEARFEKQLDDEEWANQQRTSEYLHTEDEPDCSRLAEQCVSEGLARFAQVDPDRAYVLELVVEGIDQQEIADRLGRTYGAVRTFIYECRKKLAPYVRHCLDLLPRGA